MRLRFRAHHFACTIGFEGAGYSEGFVQNYSKIKTLLDARDDLEIEVVSGLDDVCVVCPHSRNSSCAFENKVTRIDDRHAQILGLHDSQIITWGEAKRLLSIKMTPEKLKFACNGCQWLPIGICERNLNKLRSRCI